MSQIKKSTHFLCVSHVIRNIEKKLSECLIPIDLSTDNTIVDNSRSEGNEEKSLQPKEVSINYSN